MRPAPHCEHCFRRATGVFAQPISGPVMTRFRYDCRFCGETIYAGYEWDEEGNPVRETPAAGHFYESDAADGACAVCQRAG